MHLFRQWWLSMIFRVTQTENIKMDTVTIYPCWAIWWYMTAPCIDHSSVHSGPAELTWVIGESCPLLPLLNLQIDIAKWNHYPITYMSNATLVKPKVNLTTREKGHNALFDEIYHSIMDLWWGEYSSAAMLTLALPWSLLLLQTHINQYSPISQVYNCTWCNAVINNLWFILLFNTYCLLLSTFICIACIGKFVNLNFWNIILWFSHNSYSPNY